MRNVQAEDPVRRFPRTEDKIALYVAKLTVKYPPPVYNWRYDGSINPATLVLQDLVEANKKKLKRLCKKHAMRTTGNRRKLIFRMYMHWRASKFNLGDPQIGYGPGYQCVGEPDCVCGYRKRADIVNAEKRKEKESIQRREGKKAVERLWERVLVMGVEHERFPRILFPRFDDEDEAKEYYKGMRTTLRRLKI